MISEYTIKNISNILHVINEAAVKYKGVIPDKCWHDPYMLEKELIDDFKNGVHMFGFKNNEKLLGVMGIQKIKNVTLIRHAYTLTQYQGLGIGKSLLKYLIQKKPNACFLVGTWQEATWAIKFYEKFNFVLQSKKQTAQFLNQYWNISLDQIKNSVVLKK